MEVFMKYIFLKVAAHMWRIKDKGFCLWGGAEASKFYEVVSACLQ